MKNIKNIDMHRIVHSKYFFYGTIGAGIVAFVGVMLFVLAPGNFRSTRSLDESADEAARTAKKSALIEALESAKRPDAEIKPLTQQQKNEIFTKKLDSKQSAGSVSEVTDKRADPNETHPLTKEETQFILDQEP